MKLNRGTQSRTSLIFMALALPTPSTFVNSSTVAPITRPTDWKWFSSLLANFDGHVTNQNVTQSREERKENMLLLKKKTLRAWRLCVKTIIVMSLSKLNTRFKIAAQLRLIIPAHSELYQPSCSSQPFSRVKRSSATKGKSGCWPRNFSIWFFRSSGTAIR